MLFSGLTERFECRKECKMTCVEVTKYRTGKQEGIERETTNVQLGSGTWAFNYDLLLTGKQQRSTL